MKEGDFGGKEFLVWLPYQKFFWGQLVLNHKTSMKNEECVIRH
ncbi:MAG: hypothetical protein JWM28_268 [Chitinophagaceae bacterium]|nr:hypothetical protein [Chitinophagaceae bacterium]